MVDEAPKINLAGGFPTLRGNLKVTLVGGDNLLNLCWVRGNKKMCSSPYCLVFCYPVSPEVGGILRPGCWRAPTEIRTLSPRWGKSNTFSFKWTKPKPGRATTAIEAGARPPIDPAPELQNINGVAPWAPPMNATEPAEPVSFSSASGASTFETELRAATKTAPEDEVITVLHTLSRDVKYLRDEVGTFNSQIDAASGAAPTPVAAPAAAPAVEVKTTPRKRPQSASQRAAAATPWVEPLAGWDAKDRPGSGRDALDRAPVLPHMMEHDE